MMPQTSVRKRATVLAVTSGKGGVGKTNLAVNVSVALARLGRRVALVDADFGLGNIDVMLGLTPNAHVGHLLSGERSLRDVLMEGPRGISVVPAGSGLQALTALTAPQRERFTAAVDQARRSFDFVVIDTATGISDNIIETLKLAEHVLLMTSLDPAARVDAYALAKVLWQECANAEIGLVVNGVRDGVEARLAFRQIALASARFLGHHLRYFGFIPDDPAVREALLIQRPIVDHLPQSPAARCFRLLATRLASLSGGPGGLRLLGSAGSTRVVVGVEQCA